MEKPEGPPYEGSQVVCFVSASFALKNITMPGPTNQKAVALATAVIHSPAQARSETTAPTYSA